ncbi:DUF1361 domain-containing protein [Streptococcus caprae]|uniref:DUF1361 domain-containing protein n=1 Tax=Streptococcus caprae TaxID=1640501 RepID=A0ABV8CWY8_9STRE
MKKIISVHVFFAVISAAFYYKNPYGPNLVWNMFLALAALDFAYVMYRLRNRFLVAVLAILWLLFYPNTFYMLTDAVYFTWAKEILTDQQALINFFIFMSSILFGVLCGVYSWQLVVEKFRVDNPWLRYIAIAGLSLVSSFAIHIGRYARLNSWDVFTDPMMVVREIMAVANSGALYFIIGFTCFQVMTLVFTDKDYS